jgi:PAS domain-containing protein
MVWHEHGYSRQEISGRRIDLTLARGSKRRSKPEPIATWSYDILNNRIVADKNLAQMFSVSPEDACGGAIEKYTRAIHPDDRRRVEEEIAVSIKSKNNYECEYRIGKSATKRYRLSLVGALSATRLEKRFVCPAW